MSSRASSPEVWEECEPLRVQRQSILSNGRRKSKVSGGNQRLSVKISDPYEQQVAAIKAALIQQELENEANEPSYDWKGILISILVIGSISSIIVLAVYILAPPLEGPRYSGRRLQLKDILTKAFVSLPFNGTWISDEEFVYSSEEGSILIYNAAKHESRLISRRNILRQFNADAFQVSPRGNFLLLEHDRKKVSLYRTESKYTLYHIKTDHYRPLSLMAPAPSPSEIDRLLQADFFQHAAWSPLPGDEESLLLIQKNDMYVCSLNASSPSEPEVLRRLTRDGSDGEVFNGIPDPSYEAHIFPRRRHLTWFSSGGKYLAFLRIDVQGLPHIPLLQTFNPMVSLFTTPSAHEYHTSSSLAPDWGHANKTLPSGSMEKVTRILYPRADSPLPEVSLWISALEGTHSEPKAFRAQPPIPITNGGGHVIRRVSWVDEDTLATVWTSERSSVGFVGLCSAPLWMCHAIHKEDLSIAGRLRPSSVEMPVVFGRSSSTSSGPDIGFLLGLNSSAMDQWVLKEIRHKDDNSLWTERLILPIFKPPQEPPELPPDDSKDFSPPRPELGKLVEEVFNVLPIQIHWFDSQRKLLYLSGRKRPAKGGSRSQPQDEEKQREGHDVFCFKIGSAEGAEGDMTLEATCLTCDLGSTSVAEEVADVTTAEVATDGSGCLAPEITFSPAGAFGVVECLGHQVPSDYLLRLDGGDKWLLNNRDQERLAHERVAWPYRQVLNFSLSPNGKERYVEILFPPGYRPTDEDDEEIRYPVLFQIGSTPYHPVNGRQQWNPHWGTYLASDWDIIYVTISLSSDPSEKQRNSETLIDGMSASDQIEAIKYLMEHLSIANRSEVAIIGWGRGGYLALSAIAESPFVNCGMAVSAVPIWKNYNALYTRTHFPKSANRVEEDLRFNQSLLTPSKFRHKSIYLMHGGGDTDAPLEQLLLFTQGLIKEKIYFHELIYPDENHFLEKVLGHAFQSLEEFLENTCEFTRREDWAERKRRAGRRKKKAWSKFAEFEKGND